jgi:excisionase family DNA binding protein
VTSLTANPDRLLTAEDLARRWQVKKSQAWRLAREGKVPCVKLGRYTRFRLSEIEQFEQNGGTDKSWDRPS